MLNSKGDDATLKSYTQLNIGSSISIIISWPICSTDHYFIYLYATSMNYKQSKKHWPIIVIKSFHREEISKIILIFKSDNPSLAQNYRPISILLKHATLIVLQETHL